MPYHFLTPMTDPTPLSPAAQAVLDAAHDGANRVLFDIGDDSPVPMCVAAALRAAVDHIRTIGPWVGHIDSPGLDWAVLEIASIATELENAQ
jgi:hypothetical protein